MVDPSITVLIINSNVRHKLVDGVYASRREQCQLAARLLKVPALRDATLKQLHAARARVDPVVFRRARHVITENERTLETARLIQTGNWHKVGELMYASHASLRDDYEVSCRELDIIVDLARSLGESQGMIGCRMTGAGFGGGAAAVAATPFFAWVERKAGNPAMVAAGRRAASRASRAPRSSGGRSAWL